MDGALFVRATSYHPASLATTITMTLSIAGAYQGFTRMVRLLRLGT